MTICACSMRAWARPTARECGREVHAQSAQEIVDQVASLPAGARFQVLAPLARNRKGTFQDVLAEAQAQGYCARAGRRPGD